MGLVKSFQQCKLNKSVGESTFRIVRGRIVESAKVSAWDPNVDSKGNATRWNERTALLGIISTWCSEHSQSIKNSFSKTKYGSERNFFFKHNYSALKEAFATLAIQYASTKRIPLISEMEAALGTYASAHPGVIYRVKKYGYDTVFLDGAWDDDDDPGEGYRLTVQSEDTTKGTVSGGGRFEEGDSPTFTAEANVGYAFEGWYVDDEKISSSNPGTLEMPAENVTVVAKFVTVETCSISVESNNSSWGLVQIDNFPAADHDAQTVNKGTTHTIRAIATSGHYFVEWSDHNTDNPRTVTVTASQNFEAGFEQS